MLFKVVILFIFGFAGKTCVAQAQMEACHLADDAARPLFLVSVFAHGHRHGYEEGFRRADEMLHMGHLRKELDTGSVPKPYSYRPKYGEKKQFRKGYAHGFVAGYFDSFEGRSFRLLHWSQQFPAFPAAAGLSQGDENPLTDAKVLSHFDQGLARGYLQGMSISPAMNERQAMAQQAENSCSQEPMSKETGYCNGFLQGFLMGADDKVAHPVPDKNVIASTTKHP